ncbi:hypothetical protein ABPG72_012121 [Tetrahymena utriculariae]
MSNNKQLQRQERKQIQKLFEDEKQKIQQQINQNNNIIQLQTLQLIQNQTIKKCNYCNYCGTNDDMLKHIRNSHKKEFLNIKNNNNEYSICQTCNKTFKNKNIDQHEFLCRVKDNNRRTSKAMNKIIKLREKNIYYETQSTEDSNIFYSNLLSKFSIKADETLQESDESSSSEQDFEKSLERSKLFNMSTIKKRKTDTQEEKSKIDNSDMSFLKELENLNFDKQEKPEEK